MWYDNVSYGYIMKRILAYCVTSLVYAECALKQLGWVDDDQTQCLGYFMQDVPRVDQPSNHIHFQSSSSSYWNGQQIVFPEKIVIQHKDSRFDAHTGVWHIKQKKWSFDQYNMLTHPPVRLVAQKGVYYPSQRTAYTEDVDFRIGPTQDTHLVLWGHAQKAVWMNDQTELSNVQINVCSPRRKIWWLDARQAIFSKAKETIVLKHVVARLLGIPVFYMPWLDLNLKKEQDAGWLSPRVYFNRDAFFLGIPLYVKITPSMRLLLTPLVSTQARIATLLQAHYKTLYGVMSWNSFFVRDDGVQYIVAPYMRLKTKHTSWDITGYRVSGSSVIENYPRFSPSISWLIPLSMRARMHNASFLVEGGIDTFQDFSELKSSAIFPYFKREPWARITYFRPLRDIFIKGTVDYGRYVPTASYAALYPSTDFTAYNVSIGRNMLLLGNDLSLIMDVLGQKTQDVASVSQVRGMGIWRRFLYWGDTLFKMQWGALLSPYTESTSPLLDSRPIPLDYHQLFQLNRFTLQTRVGDNRDIDGILEMTRANFMLGLGMRYALKLHQMAAQPGITIYDPLLVQHTSPLLTSFTWTQGPLRVHGRFNLGDGQYFQHYHHIDYQYKRINFGIYGFKQPIDYADYSDAANIYNITTLGALWRVNIFHQWTIDGEWFTQFDQPSAGYLLALRYRDCCLQAGVGMKRSLIPLQANVIARTQWIAEIDFDTSSGIVNAIG